MSKKPFGYIFILIAFLFATLLQAEEKYENVTPPQPTANPAKIEVIEFFSYGCPHCYSFEPIVKAWLKSKPENVEFIRIPAVFQPHWPVYAKVFFTAEMLGVQDKINDDFFDLVQKKQEEINAKDSKNFAEEVNKFFTEDELAKFFTAHGAKETEFRDTFNSFMVDTKMRQAPDISGKYGIDSVPNIVVNGKYRVNSTLAGGQDKIMEVVNDLIKKDSGGK